MKFDPVCVVEELRLIERLPVDEPLMEQAGRGAAEVARRLLEGRLPRVLVMAGGGNNGGDAFVAARYLKEWFFDVVVVHNGDRARLPPDAAQASRTWASAGGKTIAEWPSAQDFGLIIDGLFGIGLTRPIAGDAARWIALANASAIPILALDIPSGLDADTGVAQVATVRAATTSTFIALKPGLLTGDGPDHCGEVVVHPLGLDAVVSHAAHGHRLDWASMRVQLPAVLQRLQHNVHKGTFGSLAIVGGHDGMVGAAILAGRAGLHMGVGKVWVGFAAAHTPAVDWLHPELMLQRGADALRRNADAVVIGPGLGTDDASRALLSEALAVTSPLVVDADALNLIAIDGTLAEAIRTRRAPTVITPHPAEAARLMQTTTGDVQANRLRAALHLASQLRVTVVLKGAGTIVARTDGRYAINTTGSAALASGGTGDVLSGMMGALIAQHIPFDDAVELTVCLHGAAADALVAAQTGPVGLTASELAPMARRLVNAG